MSDITRERLEYLGFDYFPVPKDEDFYDFEMSKNLHISNLTIGVVFIDDDRIVSIEQECKEVSASIVDLPIKNIDDVELLIDLIEKYEYGNES